MRITRDRRITENMSEIRKKAEIRDFTSGGILGPLVRFALPVLFALFLQSLYGAVDLLIVGRFASSADVSAVATGSQLMMTITGPISGFAMGVTIMLGQQIGMGNKDKAGKIIGAGIAFFAVIGLVLTIALALLSGRLASAMHAPAEAFAATGAYIRICGSGAVAIIAYNLIGSIFRGIGDSRTPLVTVMIACVINIIGDLLLVAGAGMGAAGAALATVFAQLISVLISFILIRRAGMPFTLRGADLRFDGTIIGRITRLGLPIAFSDLLVGLSFLVIQAIVNSLGLTASAGIGVAEKVTAFIMLVPISFMQSMAAFVAQNVGAKQYRRALRSLWYGIGVSMIAGVIMFYINYFHGDLLAGIFTRDPEVLMAAFDYLKAYAIDCLLTAIFFVFTGFYNGVGLTRFVMVQGIIGAFFVRIPVSFLMSRIRPVSLFRIGLATPASSIVQIILCVGCLLWLRSKEPENWRV